MSNISTQGLVLIYLRRLVLVAACRCWLVILLLNCLFEFEDVLLSRRGCWMFVCIGRRLFRLILGTVVLFCIFSFFGWIFRFSFLCLGNGEAVIGWTCLTSFLRLLSLGMTSFVLLFFLRFVFVTNRLVYHLILLMTFINKFQAIMRNFSLKKKLMKFNLLLFLNLSLSYT